MALPPGASGRGGAPQTTMGSEPADLDRLLRAGAACLGLALSADLRQRFLLYGRELLIWNARVNLTGLRSAQEVVIKHFLDSLAVWPWVQDLQGLADIGTGAGFPGLPLKLVLPRLHLTLVEASGKKTAFLQVITARLGLTGVSIRQVHLDPAAARRWGPVFPGVITRATFALERYLAVAAPLLLPGGRLLAMRGPGLESARDSQAAELGCRHQCRLVRCQDYCLPLSGDRRRLLVWEKLPGPADGPEG